MYAWNPMKAVHQVAASLIKVPNDAISLMVGIHTDGKAYWATVTDWVDRLHPVWFHNPKVKEAVLNNPAFKLIRDRKEFELSYYDEAIVGDWSELGEEEVAASFKQTKKRRTLSADQIQPEDLPEAVQPVVVDDGVLPEDKKEIVLSFKKKALRADSFQDFQELMNLVMIEAQLTENFRPSVAGLLNEYRVSEGYVAL
jgi:hypothetical protein